MSDLKVCRICLCKGVKVYNYDSFNLKQYYEEIMAKKINEKDGLPNYFCYECAAILYKSHKFKEKCWTGENVLQALLWNGSITLSSIAQIDRQGKNLQSSIGIVTVSKKVITHVIKHVPLSNGPIKEVEIPEQEISEQEMSDVEECKINYENDNSLDNKNLSEIENEMINEKDGFIEKEKPNIDIHESTEDIAMLDLEDDRRFSDDEDVWPDNTNDVDKPTIKYEFDDEITIEEHNLNTELEISEDEIELNKNLIGQKRKKAETNKDLVNKKSRKFEAVSTKNNTNDVADNTNDVDKQTIKGEVINEITVEEHNLNTELEISEDEIELNKNLIGQKRKKAETNKDLVNKKSRKFEAVSTKNNTNGVADNTNDVDKQTIKGEVINEITVEEHNLNTELEISEDEIELNKNLIGQKRKKAETNKDLVNKKSRKFEAVSTKHNTNDVADNTNDVDKQTIKGEVINEITVEEHNLNTELEISEDEIELNKNLIGQKRKKAETNKDLVNKKSRKFEAVSTKNNTNDVTDNTNDVDKKTIRGEVINEITVEEKTNLNTEPDISEDEIVFNKNLKGKKSKKAKSNKDLNKKSKRFEIVSKRCDYLDPKHWLKINLTEEVALEEFKARAQSRKYVSAAFQCSDCFKGFSKEDMLNRHVKSRHSESLGPLECRFCKMRFKLKNKLTRHLEQHYSKYKCLRCDLICCPLKNTALFHDEYHNGVIRKCIHCGAEFRHLSSYYTHLRTHRSEHVCTLCGASFVSTMGLIQHKRLMHINTVVNPEEEADTYCEKCDVKFETRKAYDEHVFHSAKHIEGVEALAVLIENPAPSMPALRKKLIGGKLQQITPCPICNRNLSSYAAYLKHHKAEHKDDPLPKEEERQICEICGASLAANSIASHLNTHTREKLYTCSTCNGQFTSKASMKRHQLTHTGEKPFECSMCEKRFTQKSSMQLHYRTFHLKEPYPKRNRRKKTDIQQEIMKKIQKKTRK